MKQEFLKKIEESAKRLGIGKGSLLHEFNLLVEEFLRLNLKNR